MPSITIHLLGTFQVKQDGRPVSGFATDKARALLAYLAVEREYPHRREQLANLLWPEQPEERSRQSLRQALSHLRQALGEQKNPHFLLVKPHEIQLNPAADIWVDVAAFKSLAQTSRKHGHFALEACLPCLRNQQQAIQLYRGEFLSGFALPNETPYEEWAILTRENLQIEAMQALTSLSEYEERRGQYEAACHYAFEQIRIEPWREESYAQSMRLLAYGGQRSAALAQFSTCQRALQKELGLLPTHTTQLLAEQIQKGQLPAPRVAACPPPAPASFVGREKEQDELAELLANPSCRLVTILGPGGIGKTRLALQVALNHAGLYRDGIFFVPLAAAHNIPTALLTLAEKLELSPTPGGDLCQILCKALHDRQMLIVLDNFEQLVTGCETLSELFRCASGIKWMITSRERLRLREEWAYPLDGLPVPDSPQAVSPLGEQIQPFAALTLFAERATQADRHFELTPALLTDVIAICQLVDGLPLGVELAAAAIPGRSCAEIASALRHTFDSLHPDLRNLPERHSSLRAAFEHSWQLLTPESQLRLAQLSVFPSGFSAEAAWAVSDTPAENLSRFIEKSLLRAEPDGRYALHVSVRQFAAEKLEEPELIRQKHAEHFAAYAAEQTQKLNGESAGEALLSLQTEHNNLQAAWDWAISGKDHFAITANLLRGLGPLYRLRGPMAEGAQSLSEAAIQLESNPSTPPDLLAALFLELSSLYGVLTEFDAALRAAQKAVRFAEDADGQPLQSRTHLNLAQILSQKGAFDAATAPAKQALTLARACGDSLTEADSLRELGNIAVRQARDQEAQEHYQQALNLYRSLGQRRGECAILNNMGLVAMNLGQYEQASQSYRKARQLYAALGDLRGEAKALNNLSNLTAEQGKLDESIRYSEQALAVIEKTGNPRGKSAILHNLGATYLILGLYEKAETHFKNVLADYRTSGNQQAEAEMLSNLGLLEHLRGHHSAAMPYLHKAIEYAEKAGDIATLSNCFYYFGRACLAQDELDSAESALRRALELRPPERHPAQHAEALAELAYVHTQRRNHVAALSLLAPFFEVIKDSPNLEGVEDASRVYWRVYQTLSKAGDERADKILATGRTLLAEQAGQISDPLLRRSFLENIDSHHLLTVV